MNLTVKSVSAAKAMQASLARAVVRQDDFGPIDRVTGVDVAYDKHEREMIAAAVTLDANTLAPIESAIATAPITFPYIAGLFSFRELPAVLAALDALSLSPQLVVCDGQGIAHPRRFGFASHLGVVRDLPTIGCAKSRLIGKHLPLAPERGSLAPLVDGNEVIGAALRTQENVRPVYISIGHRVSLTTAIAWVLKLSPRFRLPETTRAADNAVHQAMNETDRTN